MEGCTWLLVKVLGSIVAALVGLLLVLMVFRRGWITGCIKCMLQAPKNKKKEKKTRNEIDGGQEAEDGDAPSVVAKTTAPQVAVLGTAAKSARQEDIDPGDLIKAAPAAASCPDIELMPRQHQFGVAKASTTAYPIGSPAWGYYAAHMEVSPSARDQPHTQQVWGQEPNNEDNTVPWAHYSVQENPLPSGYSGGPVVWSPAPSQDGRGQETVVPTTMAFRHMAPGAR
jgi:hypothetical protein